MYVPKSFRLDDPAAVRRLLGTYTFGVLVTAADDVPEVTHLPFLYDGDGRGGRVLAHLAAANPQAGTLRRLAAEGGEALLVVQGPHGYVSPRWYGKANQVPTWNYVAAHLTGPVRLVEDPDAVRDRLARLTAQEEQGRPAPWGLGDMDGDVVEALLPHLLAFDLDPVRIEAAAKLNQNKPAEARQGVVDALDAEGTAEASALAAWMREILAEPA